MSSRWCLENWQGSVSRQGSKDTVYPLRKLPPLPLDTVYPLKDHLSNLQRMVSGGYCEGLFPDTVCCTRLRLGMPYVVYCVWLANCSRTSYLDSGNRALVVGF